MKFTVRIADAAQEDLIAACQYIARHSPENAERWYAGMVSAIQSLAEMPERCPIAPESVAFDQTIRHMVVGNYRCLYVVRESTVYVLHVRQSKQRRL